ncbi:YkgJ family cysteine cluster protein [Nitrosopumilus sp.]|uniref:YkgJ family cysteine cluster protein n=1 Tax=Nitrosopumilus sp. TaxID=2024843 RepID=UPI00247B45A6|nr:YkgJ family cysteine cluster protein [Nitrosopumilus sp.]MCV0409767.1 YkgJ family cysteine cluster protein [Nitrosopumilus sp.]
MKDVWNGLCEKCDHKSCCNDYVTPFLTPNEFQNIKKIKDEYFADKVLIKNIKGYALKKKKDTNECIFWNNAQGCTIYQTRPFDCKLFPFDIYKINGKYTWIVYSCNENADWTWSEEILKILEKEVITQDVIEHLDAFADLGRLDASDKSYKYIKLRKVKINFNTR